MKSKAVIVGFFTFLVIVVMVSFMLFQSNITRRLTGYSLTARFDQVAGLIRGSEVRYRGFRVGRVLNVHPSPEHIDASFWVSGDVEIAKGSTVKIMFDGLVGENYLSIEPNLDTKQLVSKQDVLNGRSASDLAHFIDLGHENLLHTEAILKSLVDLLDDGNITRDIKDILASLNSLFSMGSSIVGENQEYDLKVILKNIQESSSSFNQLLEQFSEAEIIGLLDQILLDVSDVSYSVSTLSEELETVINKDNINRVNSTIENIEDFSEGLSGFFGKRPNSSDSFLKSVLNTSIINKTGVFYNQTNSLGYFDSDFLFSLSRFSFITGINSRTGIAKFDQFQQGYLINDHIRTRIGIYQNYESFGVDYLDFFRTNLSLNLYDFENKLYEFSIDYPIYQQFKLAFEMYNDQAGAAFYDLGLRYFID